MNKIIYFFLVNLLLGNSFLMGQEYDLQITVKDSETREPLNSVNVIIENSKDVQLKKKLEDELTNS